MRTRSLFALIILSSFPCLVAYGQSPVGNWSGRMDVSQAKPKNAKEMNRIDEARKKLGSISFKLLMRSDKTFTVTIASAGSVKRVTQDGKWSQSGRTITVTDKTGQPRNMTISANGKQMTMAPPAYAKAPKGVQMIFSRV